MRIREYRLPVMLLAALTPAILTCKDQSPGQDVDPGTVEAFLQSRFGNIPIMADALQRLLGSLDGTLEPGVVIIPNPDGSGGSGSVQVDMDGDGTPETTVSGTLTLNDPDLGFAGGAALHVTDIAGRPVEADMTSSVTFFDVEVVQFTSIEASFQSAGNRPPVEVSEGEVYVDVSSPTSLAREIGSGNAGSSRLSVSGYVEFNVGNLFAVMLFEDDGAGGLLITVIGEDFEFTVP